ncbi:hypothetical protein J6590_088366 [Homalodisca vitripennis]|nr:hypothetical protein J6590_088366 [Homalodisca vitripennis]
MKLYPDRHLTSNSLQQLTSGPHLHQVSAASLVTMSGRYVVDPWWSSPPRQSSYLKLPATAFLWSTCSSDRHLTSNSLQQLISGPHLHQVSAASHVTMSGRYVVDPWWSSPPRQLSYLKLPATAFLWSKCSSACDMWWTPWWNSPPKPSSYLRLPATAFLWSTSTSALHPDRHLTSNSLQQLTSGPHLHQVSAANLVTMSGRYVVDLLEELSSQTVILPQTPCNSFSQPRNNEHAICGGALLPNRHLTSESLQQLSSGPHLSNSN